MFPAYMHLSAYDRHKKIINDYFQLRGGSALNLKRDTSRDKTDYDVIKENHKFLWDEDKDIPDTWEARLAKKYYDKLFKEYCICDLTYYKYNKVALRWRTEKEVVVGKGQFECGNKKCPIKDDLRSWEINFAYEEQGEKKNALVKLRLCPQCSIKLNYKSQKREIKRNKALKRLGVTSDQSHPSASSSTDISEVTVKEEKHEANEEDKDRQGELTEDNKIKESEIWKKKPEEGIEKSREEEFEEYLADLLL
ncbi:protein FRA10AC1 homolog [Chelonus insularis]|uniref:protein FRA10AC1 homolog n=1 Tax=Chelonus insularis TaxID=460826 RepID=UPI0015887201|nr:protein FRA10AC1 homolog [Chelonus insularis]